MFPRPFQSLVFCFGLFYALQSGLRLFFSQFMQSYAGLAELAVGRSEPCKGSFSLGDITILALSDRIGVVVRDGLSLLAGVEAEHALGVAPEGLAAQAHRLIVVGGLELGLAHLRDGAANCF